MYKHFCKPANFSQLDDTAGQGHCFINISLKMSQFLAEDFSGDQFKKDQNFKYKLFCSCASKARSPSTRGVQREGRTGRRPGASKVGGH